MLSGEGSAGERWKTTIGLIGNKSSFARAAHCTFLCRCFARLQRDTSRNVLVTRFMEEMSYVFSFTFFSLPLIFTLHWWPLAFSQFVTAATKLSCCCSNKKMSPVFFVSHSRSLSPFFSLSFAGLPPTFPFSLSFSCSIFQICGHDNLSKLNTLDNTDTETISTFRFRLYWLFSCLCLTRRRWLCDFLPK